jgi:hypothetical protein
MRFHTKTKTPKLQTAWSPEDGWLKWSAHFQRYIPYEDAWKESAQGN